MSQLVHYTEIRIIRGLGRILKNDQEIIIGTQKSTSLINVRRNLKKGSTYKRL